MEDRTFIRSKEKSKAGSTNNWLDPVEMKETLKCLFKGYACPRHSKFGVETMDRPYVVASMRIMTRMGKSALDFLGPKGKFVHALHSVGAPLDDGDSDVPWPPNETKYIVQFPEELAI